MKRNRRAGATETLTCEACGQLPEPPRSRLTLANIALMLPIELAVHAAVVQTGLPYLLKVLVLTVTATVLVIWIAEPSAGRLLRPWIHAAAIRQRQVLRDSPALWRARTILRDEPGALERITRSLARLDINILSIHVHPVDGGVLDEFVLSAPGSLTHDALCDALKGADSRAVRAWPTTALALADGQTKALSLAVRVAQHPSELPLAVAELLSARIEPPPHVPSAAINDDGEISHLKIPSAWDGPIVFSRTGEPFTPAESARAHRLAELAEVIERTKQPGVAHHPDNE